MQSQPYIFTFSKKPLGFDNG